MQNCWGVNKVYYGNVKVARIDLIHDTSHPCTRPRIDGLKPMSRGISGGKQVIKFANTSNRGRVCLFYQNETTISLSFKIYISSFGKMYVITVCHEDIYGRYCIQKSNNDHFHPYFDIIVFNMKRSSFPVVWNKQSRSRFLPLAIFFTCLPPEKPRDIVL